MTDTQPHYEAGDQVIVSRGKLAGQKGLVLTASEGEKIALLVGSEPIITTQSNVKPVPEPTVTRSQLMQALENLGIDSTLMVERLSNEIPGWD